MGSTRGSSFLTMIAGVAIGAALGVLFAPDEGKNTRKKLKEKFDETSEELKEKLSELNEEMKDKFSDMTEDMKDNLDSFVNKSKYSKDEMIEMLESKLRDLKSK